MLERDRGMSIKVTPMSLVLQNIKGKSFFFNIIDTPGHVNFVDEVASAIRLVDGVILIVDAIEGVRFVLFLKIMIYMSRYLSIQKRL